jgi:3-methylcrotonyl-CoA carboxylase beta subunit
VQAIYGPELSKLQSDGRPVPPELAAKISQTREDYDRWLDARYAASQGHVDALIDPLATRRVLDFAFEVSCVAPFTDHLPIQLTSLRGVGFVEPELAPPVDAEHTTA